MRIAPNHPRLRLIAIACWAVGGWWIWQFAALINGSGTPLFMATAVLLVAIIGLALGIVYWQLSGDLGAGIIFDAKGLMLNLGGSSAFISWENIASVGVCRQRNSLLDLGSGEVLGIRLHEATPYIQSYEERLPATRGPLARGLRLIRAVLSPFQRGHSAPTAQRIERRRARTGYDILIPETMLGGSVAGFVNLVETYRNDPMQRASLGRWV